MNPRLSPKVNIWLETDGKVALSRWRAELLQAVDRTGSITAAAAAMNIQYRLAWQRIHEMEDRLGVSLVVATVGGRGGGGTKLTPIAHDIIEQFTAMAEAVDRYALEQERHFWNALLDETSQ